MGFKYFKMLSGLLERLHDAGCARDRAHNRILHMDQHVSLLLLYMFNPICTSLLDKTVRLGTDTAKPR